MKKAYTIIMVLSFIYGGFLLATYCFMAYSLVWRGEVLGVPIIEGGPNMLVPPIGQDRIEVDNWSESTNSQQKNETNETRRHERQFFFESRVDPLKMLTSPFLMFMLLGGLISIANGIAIRTLTHEKEVKQIKKNLKELYLTPEEKEIVDEIEKSGGEITQRELTERTGRSRVKTHRTLQKLESKRIIQKIPYGQTNKIVLQAEAKQSK